MRRILLIALLLVSSTALAHDHDHPELDGWYKSLSSGKGPCCDGSDAVSVIDPNWEIQDKPGNPFRVWLDVSMEDGKVNMQWVDVPEDAVVHEPNKAGIAKVWPVRTYMGVIVRCFLPGATG